MSKTTKPTFQGTRSGKRTSDSLRQLAGLIYITDPDGVSAEELATDVRLQGVSPHTIREWIHKDGLVKKRQEMWQRVERKAQQKMTTVLATAQTAALRQFLEVRNIVLAHVLGEKDADGHWITMPTPPKSLEGLIKVLMDLTDKQFELAQRVGSEMVQAVGSGGKRRDPLVPASGRAIDEVRAMARAQTRERRALREGTVDAPTSAEVDSGGT